MAMYKKIGIIIADVDEYKPFREFLLPMGAKESELLSKPTLTIKINNTDIIAVCSDVGKVNAATLTTKLICEGCDVILNFGLSGGINNIKREMLCVPNRFVEYDFDLTCIGYKLGEKPNQEYIYKADEKLISLMSKMYPNAIIGTAVTGDRFVCDDNEMKLLVDNFDAVTCDMETAAIASVCYLAKIPFASIRRVSDSGEENFIELYRDMNINSGDVLVDCFYKFLESIC